MRTFVLLTPIPIWRSFLHRNRVVRLLAGIVTLLAVPIGAEEPGWFTSNQDFFALQEIEPPGDTGDSLPAGYVLHVGPSEEGIQSLELYLDGESVGSRRIEYSPMGTAEQPAVIYQYDSTGNLLYSDHLRYRPDGSLRSLLRCRGESECIDVRYGASSEQILSKENLILAFTYDDRSRIIRSEDETGRITEYTYNAGSLVEESAVLGSREETIQYRDGLPVNRVVRDGDLEVEREEKTYDTEGRLLNSRLTTRRSLRETRYRYEPTQIVEEYLNGNLERTIETIEDESTGVVREVETRYSHAMKVLIIYRNNGVRVREETLRDGQVVQTRDFSESEE